MMKHHQRSSSEPRQRAVVLGPIPQNRFLLQQRESQRIGGRAHRTVVHGYRSGVEHHLPTHLPAAPAPVNILTINEEVFIQETNGLDRLATHHPKTSDQNFNRQSPVVSEIAHVLTAENSRSAKKSRQACGGAEVIPEGWKPPTGTLQRSIRVQNARADIPDSGVLIQEVRKPVQAVRQYLHIRIHQTDISASAYADRLIVCLCESQVLGVLNQAHKWKASPHHLPAAIG
jgi:hypothetical protein